MSDLQERLARALPYYHEGTSHEAERFNPPWSRCQKCGVRLGRPERERTMTTIEPLSAEEIAGLREYHVPVRVWRGSATWIVL